MFERLFVDKHNLTNLEVFSTLKRVGLHHATVNRLKDAADLPYATTYKALQEITASIRDILPEKSKLSNEEAFQLLINSISTDCFRFAILSQTIGFKFLDELFTKGRVDTKAFCEAQDISSSVLKRRIEPAITHFKEHGVTITTSGEISGGEIQIRLAIASFYQLSYRGVGWPFDTKSYRETIALAEKIRNTHLTMFNRHLYHTKQDLVMFAVQRIRILQGHTLTTGISDFDSNTIFNTEFDSLIYTTDSFPQLTQDELLKERDFYYFSRLYLFKNRTELTSQDRELLKRMQLANPEVNDFVTDFISYLERYETLDTKSAGQSREAITFNIFCLVLIFHFVGDSFGSFFHFDDENAIGLSSNLMRIIDGYLDEHAEEHVIDFIGNTLHSLVVAIFLVVYPALPTLNNDRMLHLATLSDGGTIGSRDLIYNLEHLRFIDIIPETDYLTHKPDVIVTTLTNPESIKNFFSEETLESTPIVTWDNDNPQEDFIPLVMHLRRLLNQRLRHEATI